MENKRLKKQILLALLPAIALSMLLLVAAAEFVSGSDYEGSSFPSIQSEFSAEEQPSHEPVYISIFKFIINCNPFQKESQL